MNSANLFKSLFAYRPRAAEIFRKEDFLTAGFAYILTTLPEAAQAVSAACLPKGEVIDAATVPIVQPWRRFKRPGGGEIVPDMLIHCRTMSGEERVIIFEHKWECPADQVQLANYRLITAEVGSRPRIAFIGATDEQKTVAAPACDRAMTWSNVHALLMPFLGASTAVREFIAFLEAEGLGPARGCSDGDAEICKLISKIVALRPWTFVPARFHRGRRESKWRWGRVGVELGQWLPKTAPGLLAGFLLDGADHRIGILDTKLRIDLMLALDVGMCRNKLPAGLIHERAESLRNCEPSVRVTDDWACRNPKQILIVQEPWSNWVTEATTADTGAAIAYARFERWCRILFEDGSLETAMDTTWPLA